MSWGSLKKIFQTEEWVCFQPNYGNLRGHTWIGGIDCIWNHDFKPFLPPNTFSTSALCFSSCSSVQVHQQTNNETEFSGFPKLYSIEYKLILNKKGNESGKFNFEWEENDLARNDYFMKIWIFIVFIFNNEISLILCVGNSWNFLDLINFREIVKILFKSNSWPFFKTRVESKQSFPVHN